MTNAYDDSYNRSINDPEAFWGEAAEQIVWTRRWDKVLDGSRAPFYRWFVGGELNTCINVAGHRRSTGAMEEVLSDHPDVAECAVLGVDDELKGQVPVGFIVLKAGVAKSEADIVREVVQMVRERIGPVAFFKKATVVKRLPKTRSGKILRGTIQKIADNKPWNMPATIDDPAILDEITDALQVIGLARARN